MTKRAQSEPRAGGGVAIWLGSAAPMRSIRWLDGALAVAAKFGGATAVAAGDPTWLDLAADSANRCSLQSAGVPTEPVLAGIASAIDTGQHQIRIVAVEQMARAHDDAIGRRAAHREAALSDPA